MRDLYYSIPKDFRGAVVTMILAILFYVLIYIPICLFRIHRQEKLEKKDKMRTTKIEDDITYHVNGDWSGDLILTLPQGAIEAATGGNMMVTISMETLKVIMANYLRDRSISNIEQMSTDEIIDFAVMGNDPVED